MGRFEAWQRSAFGFGEDTRRLVHRELNTARAGHLLGCQDEGVRAYLVRPTTLFFACFFLRLLLGVFSSARNSSALRAAPRRYSSALVWTCSFTERFCI